MILHCRPKGSGNWALITIVITGKRVPQPGLIDFYIGQVFAFGPMTLRVIEVMP